MGFELFEGKKAHGGSATVRFFPGGRVHFNAAAQRLLGEASHVQLLFDRESKRVGIRPTGSDDPNGFKVTRSPSQAILSARHFVTEHNIPTDAKIRVVVEGDMLVAALP